VDRSRPRDAAQRNSILKECAEIVFFRSFSIAVVIMGVRSLGYHFFSGGILAEFFRLHAAGSAKITLLFLSVLAWIVWKINSMRSGLFQQQEPAVAAKGAHVKQEQTVNDPPENRWFLGIAVAIIVLAAAVLACLPVEVKLF
jgi:hypothetical protein